MATRIRRGVIHVKPFAASHARTPAAPPTAAAALLAPIAHCTHMVRAYRHQLMSERLAMASTASTTSVTRRQTSIARQQPAG